MHEAQQSGISNAGNEGKKLIATIYITGLPRNREAAVQTARLRKAVQLFLWAPEFEKCQLAAGDAGPAVSWVWRWAEKAGGDVSPVSCMAEQHWLCWADSTLCVRIKPCHVMGWEGWHQRIVSGTALQSKGGKKKREQWLKEKISLRVKVDHRKIKLQLFNMRSTPKCDCWLAEFLPVRCGGLAPVACQEMLCPEVLQAFINQLQKEISFCACCWACYHAFIRQLFLCKGCGRNLVSL